VSSLDVCGEGLHQAFSRKPTLKRRTIFVVLPRLSFFPHPPAPHQLEFMRAPTATLSCHFWYTNYLRLLLFASTCPGSQPFEGSTPRSRVFSLVSDATKRRGHKRKLAIQNDGEHATLCVL